MTNPTIDHHLKARGRKRYSGVTLHYTADQWIHVVTQVEKNAVSKYKRRREVMEYLKQEMGVE